MNKVPRKKLRLISLLIPVFVLSLAGLAPGVPNQGPPCVPASGGLQAYAVRLDHVWGTRTTLLVCDGTRVPFGSNARPGVVYYVPQQARDLGFDGLGIVYIIAHEWGHQVQAQRLGIQTAFDSTQHKEFQADCLAGYFIGAMLPFSPDAERKLLSFAAAIGDDRNLHNSPLSGPFGNVIDQYTQADAHGNGKGRAYYVQLGYRDGRQRGINSCAVTITPNLR